MGKENPNRKLALNRAFADWLENLPRAGVSHITQFNSENKTSQFEKRPYSDMNSMNDYIAAQKIVQKFKPSVDESEEIIMHHRDHDLIDVSGLFLSAVHNEGYERLFSYGLDIPLRFLAFHSPRWKILINKSSISDDHLATDSDASIVNFGKINGAFGGFGNKLINYGEFNTGMYHHGILVNYGKMGHFCPASNIINFSRIEGSHEKIKKGKNSENTLRGRKKTIEFLQCDSNCESYHHPRMCINLGEIRAHEECTSCPSGAQKTKNNVLIAVRNPLDSNVRLVYDEESIKKAHLIKSYYNRLQETFEAGRKNYEKALSALDSIDEMRTIGKDIALLLEKSHKPLVWAKKANMLINHRLYDDYQKNPKGFLKSNVFNNFLKEHGYNVSAQL